MKPTGFVQQPRFSGIHIDDILDFLPDAVFGIDAHGKVAVWNRALADLTGVSAEDMLGRGDREYAIPFWGHRRPMLVDLALQWDEDVARMYPSLEKKGDILVAQIQDPPFKAAPSYFWNSARKLYGANGNCIGAIEVFRDITQQILHEKSLQESAMRCCQFAEASFEGIVISENGIIIDCNRQFGQITGYLPSELLGTPIRNLFTPQERPQIMANIRQGREVIFEHHLVRKDRSLATVEAHAKTIEHANRKLRYAAVRDITERKTAEEVLRRYEMLSAHSRDIILFIRRADGKILDANDAAIQAYGYRRDELLGMRVHELRTAANKHLVPRQMMSADQDGIVFESEHQKKDGSIFPVEISSSGATINNERVLVSIIRDITERKLSEQILRQSEDKFSKAFHDSPSFMFITDSQTGEYMAVNKAFCNLTGYTANELIGKTSLQLGILTTDQRSELLKALNKTGVLQNYENRIRTKTGDIRTRIMSAALIEIQGKRCVIASGLDITDRRKAEKELRQRRQQFQAMIQAVPSIIFEGDAEGNAVFASERWFEYTGMHLEEVRGSGWRRALHTDERDRILLQWQESVRTGNPFNRKLRLQGQDGSYRWFITRIIPVRDTENRIIRWMGSLTDINDLVKVELNLRKANERLSSTIESITDAYIAMDYSGKLLEINTTADKRIFDGKGLQLIGSNVWDVYPHGKTSDFYRKYQDAIESGQPVHFEAYSEAVDGWFEAHAYPRGERLEVYLRDITERKRAEQALREKEDLLEQKVRERTIELEELGYKTINAMENDRRIMAKELHDSIGGTLAAIKYQLESRVERMGRPPETGPMPLEKIIDYLGATITECRRITKQLRPSVLDDFGLAAAAKECIADYKQFNPKRTVEEDIGRIEQDLPGDVKTVAYRVLQEALNNVSKHSQAPTVRIRLRQIQNAINLQVQDDGIGFDPQEVFGMPETLGGYGLHSMKERVEICKGVFRVQSKPGKGTLVYLSIPIKP